jgi:hypothetical protein
MPLATAPLAMARRGRIVACEDRLGTRQYQLGRCVQGGQQAMPELSLQLLFTAVDRCSGHARARGHRCSIMRPGDTSCADATPPCRAVLRSAWPKYTRSVSSGFPRWWRLGLAITEVVLAAGLIVAAVTEGGWYWWAGAIAAATLALINLSVYLRTERARRRPPDP